jgi:two-component system nitrate/nitrite response regulator NarL
MTNQPIRVLLADDHEMVLDIFALFLSGRGEMEIDTAKTLDDAIVILGEKGPFDAVLLDLNMPGMNGIAGLKRAIKVNGGKPVAILTGSVAPRMVDEIMAAGAAGIVLKSTAARSLANAIRFMVAGEQYLPMELVRDRQAGPKSFGNVQISEREMSVLAYLVEGKQNKEIANELKLAEPTIKMHVTAICRKLGAQNRTQAVVIARDMGLV